MKLKGHPAWALAFNLGLALPAALAASTGLAQTMPGAASAALASPQTGATPLTLAKVFKAARENFDVLLSRNAADAARADVLAADHAPLPTLSAKLSSIDLQNGIGDGSLLSDKRIDKGIGIDWVWERGNKRVLRTQSAQRAADAALADLQDTQLQQLLAASNAFFDVLAAQEKISHVQAIADGTAQIAGVAARRVAAGDLARQDALRLEIETERARGDVQTAKLDKERASIALAALMGAADASLPPQTQLAWPSAAYPTIPMESVLQDPLETRPDVRAALLRVAAAQAALEGASAQKKSDITWGVSYDHFPGTSTALIELRMQMPLQLGYQYQGEAAKSQAQLLAAQNTLDKTRRMAQLDLQILRAQLQGAQERVARYQADILPRAEQVAAQAELAYAKGALALNDLLDARRTLRATGLDALAARADHAKAASAWQLRTQPQSSLLAD